MSDPGEARGGFAGLRIAILTGASLAWNPRTLKEAMTLAAAGFDVVVYGSNPDPAGYIADQALARQRGFRFESAASTSGIELVDRWHSLWSRLRSRLSRDAFRLFGVESRWQLGPLVSDLFHKARAANADYYIVHLEQAGWAGARLLRLGKRVGIDLEDWYSEDLLPEARKARPIGLLRDLEKMLLLHGAHATCPSRAMSEALAVVYGCAPPIVIRNAFNWSDRKVLDGVLKDRTGRQLPSIHWYSQTLGQGRGLEELFAALPLLRHTAELHLRGRPVAGFLEGLMARISSEWRSRIFVHDLVPNEELLSRIAEHDIGFAGEQRMPPSRNLTVTNKMFQYLQGGLAVVASDTTGQAEIAAIAPEAVRLYPSGDGIALAERIGELLATPEALRNAKAAALKAAEFQLCWETQTETLTEAIRNAIAGTGGH